MGRSSRPVALSFFLGFALAAVTIVTVVGRPASASDPVPGAAQPAMAGEIPGHPGTLALNFRGVGEREPSAPDHFMWSSDVYSLATGRRVGTATHEFNLTAEPFTLDHTITFHLPEGDLVHHGPEQIAPDAAHEGFALIGIHPEGKTVVAERGTGAYAGRTGRVRMSGWHGNVINGFPGVASFNDFYLIELDPR